MSEAAPERISEKIKKKNEELEVKVTELERAVKALLKGMKELENNQGEAFMPEGDFYGIKFEE